MTATVPLIHVVDDDQSYLSATCRLLKAAGYAVRRYRSAAEFLDERQPGVPGCVLVDLRMPRQSGLDLQDALAASPDPLPVVLVSAHGDIRSSVRAIKQGAEDFLQKTAPKAELLAAVARALQRDTRERAERDRRRSAQDRLESLTPREREVLLLVVSGRLNKEIAAELGIRERTVKFHRTAVTAKLGVPSVAELALLAKEAGLLP